MNDCQKHSNIANFATQTTCPRQSVYPHNTSVFHDNQLLNIAPNASLANTVILKSPVQQPHTDAPLTGHNQNL